MTLNKAKYEISGNTFPHKDVIRAVIGASWDKDAKTWIVDLTGHSNTALGKMRDAAFKLTRNGVKFAEVK